MSSYAPGQMPPPPEPPPIPPPNFQDIGKGVARGIEESKAVETWAQYLIGLIVEAFSALFWVFFTLVGWFGRKVAEGLIEAENRAQDEYAKLAALGIEDLFGVKPKIEQFMGRDSRAAREALSRELGDTTLKALFPGAENGSGGEIAPSDEAARQWMGFIMQFSMEGWLADVVGDVGTLGFFDKFGELDDAVARNVGLERLSRRALGPMVDTFITTPLEHHLNAKHRPKLLSEAAIVEAFIAGRITDERMRDLLARYGHSEKNIDILLANAKKRVSSSDIIWMLTHGYWNEGYALAYLIEQGIDENEARTMIQVATLKEAAPAIDAIVSDATRAYINRDIERDQFESLIDGAVLNPEVAVWIKRSAGIRREIRIANLSEGDAERAVKRGFWNLQQYTDYLKNRGFNDDDILVKQLLLQDEIQVDAEAAAKKKAAEEQRAADKAAKKAADEARQAALDAERSHKVLSIAAVRRAYVLGRMTLDQYQEFLVRDKQAPEDITILIDLAVADRSEFLEAEQKRAAADRRLAVTSLTLQQLERAVELGDLTIDDWRRILTEQGVSEADVNLLQHQLETTLAEREAAKVRREQIEADLLSQELSLGQFERAVRRGIRTIADYKSFLAAAGYAAEDQEVLAALLQAVMADDAAAAAKREELEEALTQRRISVSDMERAVRRGVRSIGEYEELLTASGLVAADVQTLVTLLQQAIEQDELDRQRKAEIEAEMGVRRLALSEAARAVRLGLATMSLYESTLTREKVPAEDQAVLISILQTEIADIEAARAAKEAAEEATRNKPAPLADVARAVKQGLRTIDGYKSAVLRAGFNEEAANLMTEVLQEEVEQLAAAAARRAELDAKKAEPELTRAELERAVKAGVRQIPDYRQFLTDKGYSLIDRITLENLLLSEMEKSTGG